MYVVDIYCGGHKETYKTFDDKIEMREWLLNYFNDITMFELELEEYKYPNNTGFIYIEGEYYHTLDILYQMDHERYLKIIDETFEDYYEDIVVPSIYEACDKIETDGHAEFENVDIRYEDENKNIEY